MSLLTCMHEQSYIYAYFPHLYIQTLESYVAIANYNIRPTWPRAKASPCFYHRDVVAFPGFRPFPSRKVGSLGTRLATSHIYICAESAVLATSHIAIMIIPHCLDPPPPPSIPISLTWPHLGHHRILASHNSCYAI